MPVPEHFGILKGADEPPRPVTVSAISGRTLQPGDPRIRVSGTPYVYGVTTSEFKSLTAQRRATIEAAVRPTPKATAEEKKEKSS